MRVAPLDRAHQDLSIDCKNFFCHIFGRSGDVSAAKRRFSTPKNCIFRAGPALEGAQNAAERRPGENFGGTNEPDTRFLRRNAPKTDTCPPQDIEI